MTPQAYCEIALSMPEAEQSSHFDVTDFRIRNKIFATLRAADSRAVIKLTPADQKLLIETSSTAFSPIKGSWGLKGWTLVHLDRADADVVRHAIAIAWRTVAPLTVVKRHAL
ncbi:MULTISPECIES: MmcQ/YjbR family DNA-binding protein [Mesorhizobium]|nr:MULTISPECIES: MmcQ/YjbR family DNA-binding protein [Mesorhizobium]